MLWVPWVVAPALALISLLRAGVDQTCLPPFLEARGCEENKARGGRASASTVG